MELLPQSVGVDRLQLGETCCVCLDKLSARSGGERLGRLARRPPPGLVALTNGCTHALHAECLFEWSRRQNTCPACKARFTFAGFYHHSGSRQEALRKFLDKDQAPDVGFDEPSPPRRRRRRRQRRCCVCMAAGDLQSLAPCPSCHRHTHFFCGGYEARVELLGCHRCFPPGGPARLRSSGPRRRRRRQPTTDQSRAAGEGEAPRTLPRAARLLGMGLFRAVSRIGVLGVLHRSIQKRLRQFFFDGSD